MLVQPAVLALLLASAGNTALVVGAAPYAIGIIRHWNLRSGSARQLRLERRTYLISSFVAIVLPVQLVALFLFVFNADRMATMFAGAMCGVGTLNVNTHGFPALYAQIAVFFAASVWLAINHLDVRAPDYPLVRFKYAMLLGVAPLLLTAFVEQWRFFLNLRADVVTSCCARLFTGRARGVGGDLAALRPLPAMLAFYGAVLLATAVSGYAAIRRRGGYAVALSSAGAFVATIAGVVSFLSVYVYEQPNHHCPFCLLKAEYGYQGYWLYIPLFAATASGLAAGAVTLFASVPSLRDIVPGVCGRLARVSAVGFAIVAATATLLVLRSNLMLIRQVVSGGE